MKRQVNRLTATAVRNASKDLCDGYGLWLQVSSYDTKAWVFRFMRDGVERKMGLGSANVVTLKEARAEALEARKLVRKGIDPIEHRKAQRMSQRLASAKAVTFGECAAAYIAANRASWKNEKHADQWFSTFNQTKRGSLKFPAATAVINDLPVSAIDTGLVLKVLEPIWTKTPESASRIRGRVERVLDWARIRNYRDGENPARWTGHLEETLPKRARLTRGHHDAIPYVELPQFMAELRVKDGVSARALEFTILTAVRTGETINAQWAEFDLASRLWTLPAQRMKAGREHRIPLSDRALEILAELPREGEHVFVGARRDKPLSNMAMLELMRGMRGKGATVHGLRSTFKDWASEQTAYSNELTEIALAHAVSDKTEAAYRRGDMMTKRRALMADWASFCAQPSAARGEVVSIRREAAQ